MLYRFIRALVMPFVWLLMRPKFIGREKANAVTGAAVVVSNHVSLNDPFLLTVLFKRTLHYMAKKELFEFKPLGWLLKALKAFPVNRNNLDIKSVRNSLDVLKQGEMFAIFPEGTRNKNNELLPLKPGSSFIALKARAPIIPVFIFRPRRGKRIVVVGDMIDIEAELKDVGKDQQLAAMMDLVEGKLRELAGKARACSL